MQIRRWYSPADGQVCRPAVLPSGCDASGPSGSATLRCFGWIVEDAETLTGLRVRVATLAMLFEAHMFLPWIPLDPT